MPADKFPGGTTFHQWSLIKDKKAKTYSIRRWALLPDGSRKFERLPTKRFAHLVGSESELKDFVIRLNGKDPTVERIKMRLQFKHAFISEDVMEDFRVNYLFQQIPARRDAQMMYSYLNSYALEFFITKLNLKNPLDWHRHQNDWGKYLLNKANDELESEKRIFPVGEIKSTKLMKDVINSLNKFMKYLHLKRPDEVPPLKFEPISKAAFKQHEAMRKLTNKVQVSKYVSPDHWQKIVKWLEVNKSPHRFAIYLSYR